MQFEDAPEDYTAPVIPRNAQHSRIDDETAAADLSFETHQTLPPSVPSTLPIPAAPVEEEAYDSEEYYYSEDEEEEEEGFGLEDGLREVMDQDWADASGGQYSNAILSSVTAS
jgi:hypothetical protein